MTTPLVDLVQEQPAEVRRRETATRTLAVLSALLLLFGLVGLATIESEDGGPPGGTPLAVVFGAADKTLGQSARLTMTTEMNFGDRPGPALTAEGVTNFGGNKLQMTMKAAGLFELEMLGDGKDFYVKIPEGLTDEPLDKPWVAISVSELEKAAAENPMSAMPGASGPMAGSDPGAMLEWLKSHEAVKEAVAVGRVDIRGASTTQYRVTIDFASLMRAMRAPAEAMEALDEVDAVLDLYVDDDSLIRREVMRFGAGEEQMGGFAFSATVTIDFSDFGIEVDVDPPPADQVHRVESVDEFEEIVGSGG